MHKDYRTQLLFTVALGFDQTFDEAWNAYTVYTKAHGRKRANEVLVELAKHFTTMAALKDAERIESQKAKQAALDSLRYASDPVYKEKRAKQARALKELEGRRELRRQRKAATHWS